MNYDPRFHHRRSIRLKGYDYTSAGAYFITLVTFQRDEIFGSVINGEMKTTPLGDIVREEWFRSARMRQEIELFEDEFIVMPNHIHGIVWIVAAAGADGIRPDDEGYRDNQGAHRAPQPGGHRPQPGGHRPQPGGHRPQPGGHRPPQPALYRPPKSLGSFVAGFKSAVTGRAKRELDIPVVWQRNYYEHIIRNEKAYENIWNYINDNPRRWQADQLRPAAPPNKFNAPDV